MDGKIVIVGGGFAGFYAARKLERILPRQSAQVVLLSDLNFLLYTPLLPGTAGGTLEPRHVVVPLREELSETDIRLGSLVEVDPTRSQIDYLAANGSRHSLHYDQLIVALGSVSRVLPIPGLAKYGRGFKSISDAVALRNHAIFNLEAAETIDDELERKAYLTFVFVGGGYAGVEGMAELQDYVVDLIERYPRCRLTGTRWVMVEAASRIMGEIEPSLAEFATRELKSRGIELQLRTSLTEVGTDSVTLSTGEQIPTRTVCWTAGVKPPTVVNKLGMPLNDKGKIVVDSYLKVKGQKNIWAIGDVAAVPDPVQGGRAVCPPTAQHAIRQGNRVAHNIVAERGQGNLRKFRYKTLGTFVDLGRHQAVATILGLRIRGFPAWFAARTYHLCMMPSWGRRIRLMIDWTVGLFFGRVSAELGQLGNPPSLGAYLEPSSGEDRSSQSKISTED